MPDAGILTKRANNQEVLARSLRYADLGYGAPPFGEFGAPKAPYLLSADIIPQFAIGGKWLPVPIHFTPRFKARIFRNNELAGDSSSPVRTPSYMPGATAYFGLAKLNSLLTGGANHYTMGSFSVFHHSNGQDGNSLRPDGSFNQYDGSFSTNFVELALYHSWGRGPITYPNATCGSAGALYNREWYARVGFEQHFGTDVNLVGRYGQSRINTRVGRIYSGNYYDLLAASGGKCPTANYVRERGRIVLNTTLIMDSNLSDLNGRMGSWKRRVNAELMGTLRIASSPNVAGMLAAGYYGSDPYNAYFEDSYLFVRAGLAFGFFVSTDYCDQPR